MDKGPVNYAEVYQKLIQSQYKCERHPEELERAHQLARREEEAQATSGGAGQAQDLREGGPLDEEQEEQRPTQGDQYQQTVEGKAVCHSQLQDEKYGQLRAAGEEQT